MMVSFQQYNRQRRVTTPFPSSMFASFEQAVAPVSRVSQKYSLQETYKHMEELNKCHIQIIAKPHHYIQKSEQL